jgi:hypothetical protein
VYTRRPSKGFPEQTAGEICSNLVRKDSHSSPTPT